MAGRKNDLPLANLEAFRSSPSAPQTDPTRADVGRSCTPLAEGAWRRRAPGAGRNGPVPTLILLRHGESDWNQKNLFTGWVDVDLTATGEAEARRGGELLVEHGLLPDVVHTSLLRRAIHTAEIALDAADRHWLPVRRSWRLNERHYGALQGKNKAAGA